MRRGWNNWLWLHKNAWVGVTLSLRRNIITMVLAIMNIDMGGNTFILAAVTNNIIGIANFYLYILSLHHSDWNPQIIQQTSVPKDHHHLSLYSSCFLRPQGFVKTTIMFANHDFVCKATISYHAHPHQCKQKQQWQCICTTKNAQHRHGKSSHVLWHDPKSMDFDRSWKSYTKSKFWIQKEKKKHVFYNSSTCFHETMDENKMVIPLIVQN